LKYAKFEEKNKYISSARRTYERAVEYLVDKNLDESLLVAFAKFEEFQREVGS
jgi:crooked neck